MKLKRRATICKPCRCCLLLRNVRCGLRYALELIENGCCYPEPRVNIFLKKQSEIKIKQQKLSTFYSLGQLGMMLACSVSAYVLQLLSLANKERKSLVNSKILH